MIKPVSVIACALFALSSAPVLGAPGDEVLDEITIRVLSSDNLPESVTDIALPNIDREHEVELPDNASEAAGERANNAADAAGNAAEAAQHAADNAREHAADAAEKGLSQAPGQNK